MYRPSVISGICAAFWIAIAHCNTIILQPYNFDPTSGNTYTWIIPPQLQNVQTPSLQGSASSPDFQIQSPTPTPGGCGHPSLIRSYSNEQLHLPNEYLISPRDLPRASPPVFLQVDPVNCNDPTATSTQRSGDCTQQQDPVEHQNNFTPVQSMPDQQPGAATPQSVNWPSNHGGGIGLLFFVPESASHLPTEQLIRQQLALHRTQLPFDISMNCEDGSPGCFNGGVAASVAGENQLSTATAFNEENGENANYASVPLDRTVNNSNQQNEWRTYGELLAQQQQQQHQRQLSMSPF